MTTFWLEQKYQLLAVQSVHKSQNTGAKSHLGRRIEKHKRQELTSVSSHYIIQLSDAWGPFFTAAARGAGRNETRAIDIKVFGFQSLISNHAWHSFAIFCNVLQCFAIFCNVLQALRSTFLSAATEFLFRRPVGATGDHQEVGGGGGLMQQWKGI